MNQPMPRTSRLASCLSSEDIGLLAQVFGAGRYLYVPQSTAEAQQFEIIIGLPATSSLIDTFGGNFVYLPGLPPRDGRKRDPSLAAVKTLSSGPKRKSAATIARLFHCSIRTIYHKRAEIRRRERLGIGLEVDLRFRDAHIHKRVARKNAREAKRGNGHGPVRASVRALERVGEQ